MISHYDDDDDDDDNNTTNKSAVGIYFQKQSYTVN